MFSKRPDRYTTGFINFRNDCFANSSIQALSSLPGLIEYLNEFILNFNNFNQSIAKINDPKEDFEIPLHIALAKIIKDLQETKLSNHTISVWTFLHILEKIFNARISRSQHDSHELTQLIFETLENESLKFKKLLKAKQEKSMEYLGVNVPEFPFSGLTITQLTCVNCSNVSKPMLASFLMLSLHTPETPTTELTQMLANNEQEVIEGYSCLRCSINHILQNEETMAASNPEYKLSADEETMINKVKELNDAQIAINEDIPSELESFIKSYAKGNTDISKLQSKVVKTNSILKPPKELGLHLSRSLHTSLGAVRNSCLITFEDYLKIEIDSKYYDQLNDLKSNDYHQVKSRILTTDENDMEDISQEKVEINGPDEPTTDDRDEVQEIAETEAVSGSSGDDEDDSTSVSSLETIKESSPIKEQGLSNLQTEKLKESFKNFNLSKNSYKYRLKAIIKHFGSHTQGHYEVYRKKPIFVKDKDGNYLKLFPEISFEDPQAGKNELSATISSNSTIHPKSSNDALTTDDENAGATRLRRRLSTMVGRRRPSIIISDPPYILNSFELNNMNDGTATPNEVFVDQKEFNFSASSTNPSIKEEKIKLKKIPTVSKYPFWRISDSKVTEASKKDVLGEKQAVYMIFYERIDKDK